MATKARRGRRTQVLVELAHSRIDACQYCRPSWITDFVEDVVTRLRLRKNEAKRLQKAITCPTCESELGPLDEVGCYSQKQLAELRRQRRWAKDYARKFDAFEVFIEKYPSLGASHTMGKILARSVARLSPTELPKWTWYRARRWKERETLVAADMLPPDPKQIAIPPGRFNHAGQVGLYVADFPDVTAHEILDDPEQPAKLWIAEIEFPEPLRVLDLDVALLGEKSQLPIALEGLRWALTRPRLRTDKSPREHAVSRFIVDLVRKRKLDGVVYMSRRDDPYGPGVRGRNLIVVNFQKAKVVWGPELHEWKLTSAGHPLDISRMSFKPPIPVEWWEKLRQRGEKASGA